MNTNLKELGRFKNLINPIFYSNDGIRQVLLGKDYAEKYPKKTDLYKALNRHIKSHLFIEETIQDRGCWIFYDVTIPYVGASMKLARVIVYIACHKDVIDDFVLCGYEGNRIDILCQLVEECLTDDKIVRQFGVGKMDLEYVDIFTRQRDFCGKILNFKVPNFKVTT